LPTDRLWWALPTLIWLDQSRVELVFVFHFMGTLRRGEEKSWARWMATVISLIYVDWLPT
jgi:hypothetical protein